MDDIHQYLIEDDIFKSIEEEVICSICTELAKNPVTCSKCQHSFCQNCIDIWKTKSNICPYKCNDPQYSKNRLINNLLSKLHFKCPNGCNEIILYDNFEKHRKECNQKIDYKLKYEKLLTEYNKLKINYQGLEKTFNQYKQTMENQMKLLKELYNKNLLQTQQMMKTNQQRKIQNQNTEQIKNENLNKNNNQITENDIQIKNQNINQKQNINIQRQNIQNQQKYLSQYQNKNQQQQNLLLYSNKSPIINQNKQNQNSDYQIKKNNSMNANSSSSTLKSLKSFPHFHKDSLQFSIAITCSICEGRDNGILCKMCDIQICETCCKKLLIARKNLLFHEHELNIGKTKDMLCKNCQINYTKLTTFMMCLKCNYYCCIFCYMKTLFNN